MTCVVGVAGPRGRIILGADSASTDDNFDQELAAQNKVWKSGDFLMGGAGSWRGLQLAQYAFTPPKRSSRMQIDKYMVTDFIDGLRKTWKGGGHLANAKPDEGDIHEEVVGTDLLVGYRGELWVVRSDLQIIKMRDPFTAIGSGTIAALGALYATRDQGATRARVLTALRSAEKYNAAVRGPFIVIETGGEAEQTAA